MKITEGLRRPVKDYLAVSGAFELLREHGVGRSLVWIHTAIKDGRLRSEKLNWARLVLREDVMRYIAKEKRKVRSRNGARKAGD